MTVTVKSQNPSVAVPAGAVNGELTLTYGAAASDSQTITVVPVGLGRTTLSLTSNPQNCVVGSLTVDVVCRPKTLMTDDFSGTAIDNTKWSVDTTPLVEGGLALADSAVSVVNGQALLSVICEAANYPGFTLWTTKAYAPTLTAPVSFEIDRSKMEYVLVGGTDARQRTGIWIKNATGNYVFFSEFGSWSTYPNGWQYHRSIGQDGDNPVATYPDGGTYLAAFNAAKYTDQKSHRMEIVANGTTAKLLLDGGLGAEVPFPFADGIVFGFGAYVNFGNSAQNVVRGYFDNPVIMGECEAEPPKLTASLQGANVVITWTGQGALQSATTISGTWGNVTPPPTGNSYTVPATQAPQQYFRLRQ
jgi:hypothetical protein